MSAERKIAIFDPDVHLQDALKNMFQNFGHTVVASAQTSEQAKKELDRLDPGDCDIFLVNGEMRQRADSHQEGEELVRIIGERGLGVVIGISLENLEGAHDNVIPGTVDMLTDLDALALQARLAPAA